MNSQLIGNSAERFFSREFSLWASDGKDDDVFWRDLSSSARFTNRKKKGLTTEIQGDIFVVKNEEKYKKFSEIFYVDTKSYKEFNPFVINQKNIKSNKIFIEWVKTCNDSYPLKKPMMPVKIRDRNTPIFIMMGSDISFISQMNYIRYNVFYKDKWYSPVVVVMEDFFKSNPFETFIQINSTEV